MKSNKLSAYSIIKYISYEALLEEQLQSTTENERLFERLAKKRNVLKIKFLSYKIINSIIFAVQPIFLLMAYSTLNSNLYDFLDFHTMFFIKAVNFHFFFIVQLFNFFLLGLFSMTTIMSGDMYEWIKTFPLSRRDLKKLAFYSIYHNLNVPIIINTLAFPVIMLIATQNFIVFLISLGISILNMIFSLSVLIISSERIAKFMKRFSKKSRKPLIVQLLNTFSYVLVIFGGIFVIEIALNLLIPFLLNLTDIYFVRLYNLILFLIPFPFNASYLVLLFTSAPQMHIIFWLNLLYGFGLYLISIYFLLRKSFKSLNSVILLKYKEKSGEGDLVDNKYPLKIHAISHFKAFIRKDLLTASRDLQTSMYFIMPIVYSFTSMFFFNFSLLSGMGPLDINLFLTNWIVILGLSPVLSAVIVYSVLNIDKQGIILLNTLPIIRRHQATSKLVIVIIIQLLAVLSPSLIYILNPNFMDIFLASVLALPLVLSFTLTTFIMRVRYFGKKKYYYTLDEVLSNNKIGKWTLILLSNYLIYVFAILISTYVFYVFNFLIFIFNEVFLSLIFLTIVMSKFKKYFPKEGRRNRSLTIAISLIYCYVIAHLLLLSSVLSISLQYAIVIACICLTGIILTFKYTKFPLRILKRMFEKLKPNSEVKDPRQERNWMRVIILISGLFFAYSLIPIIVHFTTTEYLLIGIFLVIFSISLILLTFKSHNKDSKKELVESKEFFQIDFLKAFMIFMVIFDHTIPWTIKNGMGVALWERIAIPVFLVIMGFNFGHSYKTRGKDNFGTNYLFRKLSRYLLPFVIIYVISVGLGLYFYHTTDVRVWLLRQDSPYSFIHLFIGILPFWGPGNWFMPLLFGSIIILPIIFKGFSGRTIWAIITLVLCFLIEIGMQYIVYSQFRPFDYGNISIVYMFLLNILYYTSALGLGMWISRKHELYSWHNLIIWILFSLSLIYIIWYQFFGFRLRDSSGVPLLTGDYNFLVTPYAAFLVLFVIKILPKTKKGIITRSISVIGKSTYHILLVQIMYFAILIAIYGDHYGTSILGTATTDLNYFFNLFLNWALCVPIGIIWWSIENSIRNSWRKKYKKPTN
ncbi:MAG: hypothetical protein EAX91_01040 [Candidatus Lokiarchaeota archaeon]|nr:hypothetical protein [Candidatus Lokiarchaeota archaeon]